MQFMLSVSNMPFMLTVVILNAVYVSVSNIPFILSVVMLSVVAPRP